MSFYKKHNKTIFLTVIILVIVHLISGRFYSRFDLTQDHRYTISEASKKIINTLNEPVIIDILLAGDLQPEFKKLQTETRQLLEEFAAINPNIKFSFVDPLEGESNQNETISNLQQLGLTPLNVTVSEGSKVSQEFIFPWAVANLGNKSVKVSLLKSKLGASSEERVNNSVQHLEYGFSDAFKKLTIQEKKKIAVLKGNGELDDIYLADFLTTLRDYYRIAPITLDSIVDSPQKTFNQLQQFDLTLIAKPTKKFSEEEKYVLDQYMMHGGKSIWLIDQTAAELDSLFNDQGKTIAFPRDLNLNDLFFNYGVRINPVLVNDLYFTQIVLATGAGNDSQYNPLPWFYSPMVFSKNNHPINNNIEALRFQFANNIDTLKSSTKKTILLSSSPLSKTDGTPREISLDIIGKQPDKNTYNDGDQTLAVLLEGTFSSAYQNRVKPLKITDAKDQSTDTKMLVVADGDLIKNQTSNGRPLELGYDKWTNNFYGNKEFLLNSVNYMLDDSGLINIRSKKVALAFLDTEKVVEQKKLWQVVNIGAPIVLLLLFGWIFNLVRRKKYTT
ncbi:gliding-associated putative ABC transporter substrate-binding component GldG [Zhouia amylolytica]|uniref:Gliding-associated putative ABC transporter substrate-binding component GldG n=1 Tax=Zhouia amylolytica TaxID=376730 RepID=A0A1I6TBV1_9FLAO|nr:gliding motility-associated ABC transporter substrate-binding protein GldG [Zhouia amylolytica]MCQ0112222.1 gliding motility-associated ABC transporter substrate-binding protein GldG [Zhouia amylolytica]SFS86672.1 gliding-associated putative ABC transporter substrate-binding component GldG [Zhouia amylolytica]